MHLYTCPQENIPMKKKKGGKKSLVCKCVGAGLPYFKKKSYQGFKNKKIWCGDVGVYVYCELYK